MSEFWTWFLVAWYIITAVGALTFLAISIVVAVHEDVNL